MTNASGWHAHERLSHPQSKRDLNREIFAIIAPGYDRITRLLSFGRDAVWKDRLIAGLPAGPVALCLDLACGTGDITLRLAAKYPAARIVGLDLSDAMLARARARAAGAGQIRFVTGDMGNTGQVAASVDIVTGGYALRNAGDLDETIAETFRILKPGGMAAFLDFSKPQGKSAQRLELFLLRFWGGLWGAVFHRNPGVYTYIAESLQRFPDRRQLAGKFQAHGFAIVSSELYFCGFVQRITLKKTGAQ